LKDFANQDYQYEKLVDQAVIERDASRNPLFNVLFALQDISEIPVNEPGQKRQGLTITPYAYESKTSKFDLAFFAHDRGEKLYITIEYCTRLFRKETIQRFANCFKTIISAIVKNSQIKISGMEIISRNEKQQVLFEFNNTSSAYSRNKSIIQLFEQQVEKTPQKLAVVFQGESITYKELNERSAQLAAYLCCKGLQAEQVVGIMVDYSLEMIVGILAVLKAGGVYLPINVDYPQTRKKYMLKDSNVRLLLTDDRHKYRSNEVKEIISLNDPASYISTNEGEIKITCIPRFDRLAYVMYTSGSTGAPKGVMVEHRSVVRLVNHTNYIEFKQGDRILQTGALEFDASTFEIWGALLNGLTLFLVEKERLVTPLYLKDAVTRYCITTLWMTSPLFNRMQQMDIEIFSGLRNLLVGGDVLSPMHINGLRQRFPGLNVINGYGPTENTTFSTTFLIEKEYKVNIPIGKPIANSTVYILDKYNHPQPINVAGELYVGGDGAARGYLNRPELTAEKFRILNKIGYYRSYWSYKSYIIYKTGDLARWLADGNIEFLGRIDSQVKIRGYRVEPGEIENQLMIHDAVKELVVIDREDETGDKYLCAYIVGNNELDFPGLREFLSGRLPDYMTPSHFVEMEKLPLMPTGKIDRRALPLPEIEVGKGYVAPGDEVEKKLTALWSAVLGVDPEIIGIETDFFQLGGHSLKATTLTARIHKEFAVRVPLMEIFKTPTIRGLAGYIRGALKEKYAPVKGVEKREYYVLSSTQQRLYFLQQMDLKSTVYNMPQVVPLGDRIGLQRGRLEKVFRQLIQRHESLRTSFVTIYAQPVQRVHKGINFQVEYYDYGDRRHIPLEEFVRPFDLSCAPLLRASLIGLEKNKGLLVVDMHHIISDGVSMEILVEEFMALYQGERLLKLWIQYKDYAQWQNNETRNKRYKNHEEYWLKEFADEVPGLNLPLDYERPAKQSFEGSIVEFEIGEEKTTGLKSLALVHGATLYMVLLSIFNILLSKLSGQEDIVVGTPVAGRGHADLQKVIGMFVNTLALRNFPAGNRAFSGFLYHVKERTLNAFEHQDYPFADLVEKLARKRDETRNPIFDVLFVLQDINEKTREKKEEQSTGDNGIEYDSGARTSKFDLMLFMSEDGGKLHGGFEYRRIIFKKDTLERFARYFIEVIEQVTRDKDILLKDIRISHGLGRSQTDLPEIDFAF
jgi:amino acid adenylation domain-containing protein